MASCNGKEAGSRIVLLGAGASVEAGVPAAIEMTHQMAAALSRSETEALYRAFEVIKGGLQMGSGWSHSINSEIDIERVINAAQLLANRFDAELSPFVGNWHPVLEELERRAFVEEIRGKSPPNSLPSLSDERKTRDFLSNALESSKFVYRGLTQVIQRCANGQLFEQLRVWLTANLVRQTWITDQERVKYLSPLIRAAAGEKFPIVTLNYDNSIELCSESIGVAIEYPVLSVNEHIEPNAIADYRQSVRLIKLHGSANWRSSNGATRWLSASEMQEVLSGWPYEEVLTRRQPFGEILFRGSRQGDRAGEGLPAVIFGGKNKLTAEGPFLDLFYLFRDALRERRELVVIGYAFRDDHVNHVIWSWLRSDKSTRIVIITKGDDVRTTGLDRYDLSELAREGRLVIDTSGAGSGIASRFA